MKLSLGWALGRLHDANVRVTPVRERVIECLAAHDVPLTLHEISQSGALRGVFDAATIYRTVVLLVELEIVRQFRFRDRAISFLLNTPGECFGFLICRGCGAIQRIPHGDQIQSMEEEAATRHGFSAVTHELELYGLCPECQTVTSNSLAFKPTKLLSGMRLRRLESGADRANHK